MLTVSPKKTGGNMFTITNAKEFGEWVIADYMHAVCPDCEAKDTVISAFSAEIKRLKESTK